jgi:hypothetical protein
MVVAKLVDSRDTKSNDPFLIGAEQWQEGVVLGRRMSSSGRGVRQILK